MPDFLVPIKPKELLMKHVVYVFAAAVLTASIAHAAFTGAPRLEEAALPPASPPLKVFLSVEFRGLEPAVQALARLGQTVNPMASPDMLRMMAWAGLNSPLGIGIDSNRTIRAFFLLPMDSQDCEEIVLALSIPGTDDGLSYLAVLDEQLDPARVENDIHIYPGAGFAGMTRHAFLHNNHVVLVDAEEDQAVDFPQLISLLDAQPSIFPIEGEIALGMADVQDILHLNGLSDIAMANPMYEMVDSVFFGISVLPEKLITHTSVAFTPGSVYTEIIQQQQVPSRAANSVVRPDATAVGTTSGQFYDQLKDVYLNCWQGWYQTISTEIAGGVLQNEAFQEGESAMTYLAKAAAWFGPNAGFALLPPEGNRMLRGLLYHEVKDVDALRAAFERFVNKTGNIPFPINATETEPLHELLALSSRTHADTEISIVTLDAGRIELSAIKQDFAKLPMLADLTAEIAWLPDGILVSTAGEEVLNQTITAARSGDTTPVYAMPEFKQLFPDVSTDAVDLGYIHLQQIVHFIQSSMNAMSIPMAFEFPDDLGSIAVYNSVNGNAQTGHLAIRLADIEKIAATAVAAWCAPSPQAARDNTGATTDEAEIQIIEPFEFEAEDVE